MAGSSLYDSSAVLVRKAMSRWRIDEFDEELDLGRHQLKLEEAIQLAAVCSDRRFRVLTIVDLRFNHLGDEGVKKIAHALEVNRTVTSLNVSRNGMGEIGVMAVAALVVSSHSIKHVDVSGNPDIPEAGWLALSEALANSKSIASVRANKVDLSVPLLKGSKAEMAETVRDFSDLDREELIRTCFGFPDPATNPMLGTPLDHETMRSSPAGGGQLADAKESEGGKDAAAAAEATDEIKEEKEDTKEETARADGGDAGDEHAGAGAAAAEAKDAVPALDERKGAGSEDGKDGKEADNKEEDTVATKVICMTMKQLNFADALIIGRLATQNLSLAAVQLCGPLLPLADLLGRGPNGRSGQMNLVKLDLQHTSMTCVDTGVLVRCLECNFDIRDLNLSHNDIGVHGVGAFGKLLTGNRTIKSLDLSFNLLTHRGDDESGVVRLLLGMCENLGIHTLRLQENQLKSESAAGLAQMLEMNGTLTDLDFTDNPIEDDNGGDGLIEPIKKCRNLRVLNRIELMMPGEEELKTGKVGREQEVELISHAHLHVNLAHHQYDGFQRFEAAFVAQRLFKSRSVVTLDLSRNTLYAEHVALICEAAIAHPTLEELNLAFNRICGVWLNQFGQPFGELNLDGIEKMAQVLLHRKSKLKSLNLRGCTLRDPNFVLANALQKSKPLLCFNGIILDDHIVELELSDRKGGLSLHEGAFLAGKLGHGLKELDCLYMASCVLTGRHSDGTGFYEPYSGLALARGLRTNTNLATLDISSNELGPQPAAELFLTLASNAQLETLRVSRNSCFTSKDSSAVAALAEMLQQNQRLTCLDISRNGLEAPGAEQMSHALAENRSILNLDLSGNPISPAGAGHVAFMLKRNSSLAVLAMRRCRLSGAHGDDPTGCVALADALTENNTLVNFDLTGNGFSDNSTHLRDAIVAISDCLFRNDSVLQLKL